VLIRDIERMEDCSLRRKQIVRVRFEAMLHANAGTGVEMVRVTMEDTRTEGRQGCVQNVVDCETRRRQRLKTLDVLLQAGVCRARQIMIFLAGHLLAVMSPPHHHSSRRWRIARAGCHRATRVSCGMRSDRARSECHTPCG
jgi:hypothetical protein